MTHRCNICNGELFLASPVSDYWACEAGHVFSSDELIERAAIMAEGGEGYRGSHKPKKGKCTCGSGNPRGNAGHSDWCDIDKGSDEDDFLDIFDEITLTIDPKGKKKP